MNATTENQAVSVILPTYNEAENIAAVIELLRAALDSPEIIVVDDDSPDDTWRIAQASGVQVIRRTQARGLASAIKAGIDAATGDVVVWMDCDLSMPPRTVPLLVNAITAGGADIAVGSRYAPGGRDVRPWLRTFTSRLINGFATLLLPVKVKDYDSGFLAVRRDVFSVVPLSDQGYGEYCIEFLCMAGLNGYRITEVGFEFTDRMMGQSKTAAGLFSFFRLGLQYARRVLAIKRKCRLARTPKDNS